jgi:cytoskeletal protein RodZ
VVRERLGVSLDAIIQETRISRRFLEAIEDGRYGELPGGVFSTSYIRQYAKMSGNDVEEMLSHYRVATAPVEEEAGVVAGRQARPVSGYSLFALR